MEIKLSELEALLASKQAAALAKERARVYDLCLRFLTWAADNVGKHNDTRALATSLVNPKNIHEHEWGYSIVFDAPHAAIVEYGTRPHFPPIQPIKDWVHRKIRPMPRARSKAQKAAQDAAEHAIALAICRKIAAHGTKPVWYAKRAFERLQAELAKKS